MKASHAIVVLTSSWLGLAADLVHAGTSLVEIDHPAQILAESDASFSTTVRDRRQESGRILRCWQHGRLLYEGSGFTQPAVPQSSSVVVNRKDGEMTTLFNFQDGLCILSDR
ncbi:MAG: hypothetical protein LBB76_13080 [Azoarcus sp.]|nr:hypothetical protein [Azoarcus sp.]